MPSPGAAGNPCTRPATTGVVRTVDKIVLWMAVFGSVARNQARAGSDIDLIVEAPHSTSSFEFVGFKQLLEKVLGREIDLVKYGGLKPGLDDDVWREAVLL